MKTSGCARQEKATEGENADIYIWDKIIHKNSLNPRHLYSVGGLSY